MKKCAIDMGVGTPPVQGACTLGPAGPCFAGQDVAFPGAKSAGDSCSFKDIAGTYVRYLGMLYCNIWPISPSAPTTAPTAPDDWTTTERPCKPENGCIEEDHDQIGPPTEPTTGTPLEPTTGRPGKGGSGGSGGTDLQPHSDMIEACRVSVGDGLFNRCALHMGEGVKPIEGLCTLGPEGPCDVGQMVPHSTGKGSGDKCEFKDRSGVVVEYSGVLYCNIWSSSGETSSTLPATLAPTSMPESTRAPATTLTTTTPMDSTSPPISTTRPGKGNGKPRPGNDMMEACRVSNAPEMFKACAINMGEGAPAMEGRCNLGPEGPCVVGQEVHSDAGKSPGDKCIFASIEGRVIEHFALLFCDIWPIEGAAPSTVVTTTTSTTSIPSRRRRRYDRRRRYTSPRRRGLPIGPGRRRTPSRRRRRRGFRPRRRRSPTMRPTKDPSPSRRRRRRRRR